MAHDIAFLLTRFGEYEKKPTSEDAARELKRLGAKAVPALAKFLADEEHGWLAASILSEIGAPAALEAVPALEQRMKGTQDPGSCWSARALASLGEWPRLVTLLKKKATAYTAVQGLKEGRPFSYPALEAALELKRKDVTKYVADALQPGSARFEPPDDGMGAMLAALRSKHVVIRRDATCNLINGARDLESKRAAVTELLRALDDKDMHVRRLAILGLAWAGRTVAKQHLPMLERRFGKEKDEKVRNAVDVARRELG